MMLLSGGLHHNHRHHLISAIGSIGNYGSSIRRSLVHSSRRYVPPRHRTSPKSVLPRYFKRSQNHMGGIVVAGLAFAGGLGSTVIMAQSESPEQQQLVNNFVNETDVVVATSVKSSLSPLSSLRKRDFPLREHHHGKTRVRILKVFRDGHQHVICEYIVETKLFCKEYAKCFTKEDNSDLVATDTQRNTVYLVAKRCGPKMTTPEDFGIALCQHFLKEYPVLDAVEVNVHQVLWERVITEEGSTASVPHPHGFIKQAPETYACQVQLNRTQDGKFIPKVTSSIQKMTILKTTQSGFEGYLQDKYTLLPPARERCLATELDATWTYDNTATDNLDYADTRRQVRQWLLHGLFGPPPTGVYSASLQATIYDAACLVLEHIPQVRSVKIDTPNLHYLPFMQLNQLGEKFENDIFVPTNEPSGSITCTVTR